MILDREKMQTDMIFSKLLFCVMKTNGLITNGFFKKERSFEF